MEQEIKALILSNSVELFGQQIDEQLIQFQKTRKDIEGDLTLVIFPFVKLLKCSPQEAGNRIGELIVDKLVDINAFAVVGGFLNLIISDQYWLNQLKRIHAEPTFGCSEANSKIGRAHV